MATIPLDLDGYTDLPPGRIANIVTFLEMREAPNLAPGDLPDGDRVRRIERPSTDWYRSIYHRIGEQWLWFSRAVMPDRQLAARLASPEVEIFALERDGNDIGFAEIDHSSANEPEIAMFGVVPEATGTGAAHLLMERVIINLWTPDTRRIWLHTCTFDHPGALRFYRRAGFTPYKFAIEVSADPRLTGHLPRTAGAHIPLIG